MSNATDRLIALVRDRQAPVRDRLDAAEQLAEALIEADKTVVENWGIDEENARLRAEVERLRDALDACKKQAASEFETVDYRHDDDEYVAEKAVLKAAKEVQDDP